MNFKHGHTKNIKLMTLHEIMEELFLPEFHKEVKEIITELDIEGLKRSKIRWAKKEPELNYYNLPELVICL